MKNPAPPNKLAKSISFYSMRHLEHVLGVGREELRALARSAGSWYSPFLSSRPPKPFQRKFSAGKTREIDCPVDRLKAVQKIIDRRILKQIELPTYLCGGVKGRSLFDNFAIHAGAKVLVTIDIRSFFPNITTYHVYHVWHGILGSSPEISGLLTRLTTFRKHLPQGAPTSTMLANLVLYSVDRTIREACAQLQVSYSTWVDDIAFSGDNARQVINTAVRALMNAGFAVPHRKTKIMGPGSSKVLTGVLVRSFPSVLKERVDRIRSGIHKLRCSVIDPEELDGYLKSLSGNISQLSTIDPIKGARLQSELDSVLGTLDILSRIHSAA